ncbi:MAG: NAD-dependent epimerase/dehydratase family protein [Methylobacteriaceae bacterium]|nr:NAD-dependent epimerase/dehydratase family protein [Methylobacteriaceae bacterium]
MNQISERTRRAVVTGASGFVGTRLVGRLLDQGYAVTAVDLAPPRIVRDGARYVTGDVRETLSPGIAQGAEVIYNLAAVHRTPGHPAHEYYDTNVLGAANVTALADACSVPLVVFTSSISVYGPSELVVTEQSPLHPNSDYGRSKRMAEVVHRKWLEAGMGRRLVVVRPGVIFGPGERGNYTNLAKALRRRMFAYPGRRDTVKSGGHVDELLRCVEFAISKCRREVLFNFAFPDESTTEEIVGAFSRVAGYPSTHPTIPVAPLLAAATLFEAADALGIQNPIHRERVMKLFKSTRVAPAWLLANGYEFEHNLETALAGWAAETQGRFD